MKIQSKWAAVIAEFIGTFALTFAVIAASQSQGGALQLAQPNALGSIELFSVYFTITPFAAAITLGLFVALVGGISGGHINPAVTIGLWTLKKISTLKAVSYIVFQSLGALLALLVANLFVNSIVLSDFTTSSTWQLLTAEAIGTFALGFGVAAAVLNKKSGFEAGAFVGTSLFVGILFAAFAAGAGILNPAVMIGVKSIGWAFILGPIIGAVIGMQVYKLIFDTKLTTAKAK